MFENINQSKKDQKGDVEEKKDVALDFGVWDGILRDMDFKRSLIDKEFILSSEVLFQSRSGEIPEISEIPERE